MNFYNSIRKADKEQIKVLVNKASLDDLLYACRVCPPDVASKITEEVLDKQEFKNKVESLGPTTCYQVADAQDNLLLLFRKLFH